MEKIKDFFKNPKLKNPYFLLGLVSMIFASANVDFNTLTSWKLLGEALLSILNNPVSVIAVITGLVAMWNNNDTLDLDGLRHKGENENK